MAERMKHKRKVRKTGRRGHRKGKPLTESHKKAISEGMKRHHRTKRGGKKKRKITKVRRKRKM